MEKRCLFLGIAPRGTAGVIVRTLTSIAYGETPTLPPWAFEAIVKNHGKGGRRNRRWFLFKAQKKIVREMASGSNGQHSAEILSSLIEFGFTKPRIMHVPLSSIERYSKTAAVMIAEHLPVSLGGSAVVIIGKDRSGRWRLFA